MKFDSDGNSFSADLVNLRVTKPDKKTIELATKPTIIKIKVNSYIYIYAKSLRSINIVKLGSERCR